MAKKVSAYIKLQVGAGNANPAPPVGPALGQHGVNIMEFCKAFNAKTANMEKGLPVPVTVFCGEWEDGSTMQEPTVGHGIYFYNEYNNERNEKDISPPVMLINVVTLVYRFFHPYLPL